MEFFSVYDVLLDKTREKKLSVDEMFLFFRKRKISKKRIEELQQSVCFSCRDIKDAVLEYLEMSELELNLRLGFVPSEYRESYYNQIDKIAELLVKSEKSLDTTYMPYYENSQGRLYKGDCTEVLRCIPDESIDMVFADPPFNLGKAYDPGVNDDLTMSEYLNWTFEWLDECVRVLKVGGRIFVYNLPQWCVFVSHYLGKQLTYWDWIAIDMKYTLPLKNRLYPSHYALISYIKGIKANTFNNQRIPMQVCRHCGGEVKDYGGYKSKMDSKGLNVSDVWTDIYPVRHKNTKNRKYNELSVKLLDRIISMSTNPEDTILDPFGGSGTTFAVAQALNRKWIGIEIGDCEIIKNRLLNPTQDLEQLRKISEEKGRLFTEATIELRKQHNFWTCDSFERTEGTSQ